MKSRINSFIKPKYISESICLLSYEDSLNDKLAIAFHESAKKTLKISKLCYNNDDYPNCIFNLQQCVEKLVKAEFIGANLYQDPKDLGHNPHKAFQDIFMNQVINELKDEKDEIGFEICKKCIDLKNNYLHFFDRVMVIKPLIRRIEEYANNFIQASIGLYEIIRKQFTLMALAYLFYGTEQNSRYPDIKDNQIIMPHQLYKKGLKIHLTYIIDKIEIIIRLQESPLIANLLDISK